MKDLSQFSKTVQDKAAAMAAAQAELTAAEVGQETILAAIVEGFNQIGEAPAKIAGLHRTLAAHENDLARLIAAELRDGPPAA